MAVGTITFDVARSEDGHSVLLSLLATGMTKVVHIEQTVPKEGPDPYYVRGSVDSPAVGGAWNGQDYEAPAGEDILYEAVVEDESDSTQAVAYATLPGGVDHGGDWIMPIGTPEGGTNVFIEYGGMGTLNHNTQRDVISVIGRADPVVVNFGLETYSTTVNFLTLDSGERDRLLAVLASPVVVFTARPGFGFRVPQYFSVGQVTEERTVGLGSEQSRRFLVDLTKVARPPAHYAISRPSTSWQSKLDDGELWETPLIDGTIWYDYAGYRLA